MPRKKPAKKTPKKVGAPTLYRPEFADRARRWYAGGATELEVADRLRVAPQTIYEWKAKHKEFADAATQGRQMADDQVEAALFKRAIGCKVKDTHFATIEGRIESVEFSKEYAPDTAAAQFWLKNRRPGAWRDKQEFGVTDTAGNDAALVVSLGAQIAQSMRKKE